MSPSRFFSTFVFLAASAFSLAAAAPKQIASVEGITEFQLDNGLRVLLFPDSSQSKVTVNMTVLVGSQHKINTPDKANATYTAGLVFPLRDDDPDYPPLLMGNYLLGSGALSSRLGTRVRQREGLSYSIGSSLTVSSFDQRAGLTITAICNPQNIHRVEKAVQEELDRLLRDGVTKEELTQGKQGYLQAQTVGRSSDSALVGILANLSHVGRTMAFQAELEKKIESLTPEEIVAALRKHIDPKKLVIVTAGDFETNTTSAAE
jgi:zinc protease